MRLCLLRIDALLLIFAVAASSGCQGRVAICIGGSDSIYLDSVFDVGIYDGIAAFRSADWHSKVEELDPQWADRMEVCPNGILVESSSVKGGMAYELLFTFHYEDIIEVSIIEAGSGLLIRGKSTGMVNDDMIYAFYREAGFEVFNDHVINKKVRINWESGDSSADEMTIETDKKNSGHP
ncbi:MAG: hypothetical protein HC838_15460 [Spirulinaceae cyanobacterium RM2_2_10]|nr:hypothetical protein [Spirulinaceae cyanobacterium RM2_2_10]